MDEKLKSSIFTEIVSRSVKDVLKKIFYTLHHKQHSSQIQSALAQMINFVVLESSAALSQLSTVISSKFDLNEGDYEKAEFRSDKFISRISFFFNCNIHPRSIKKLFLKGIRLTLEDIIFIDSRIEKMFDHNLCDWTPLIHCFFPKRLPNSFFLFCIFSLKPKFRNKEHNQDSLALWFEERRHFEQNHSGQDLLVCGRFDEIRKAPFPSSLVIVLTF